MILIEMYSKEDCHLCEEAEDALRRVQKLRPFELRIVKLHEGDEDFEKFKERFPVVYIEKEYAFQYRVPEGKLLNMLEAAG
ncbi:MAG TPA: glutaredoxin family protein [Bacteroidota bacterium]|nr:glutaredoxin family protein [Bacteroidota bacterium]